MRKLVRRLQAPASLQMPRSVDEDSGHMFSPLHPNLVLNKSLPTQLWDIDATQEDPIKWTEIKYPPHPV